tara:strand:- start:290 stop:1996 length:1707 start_codon:yes stop_codon:yes gene_type:complete
MADPTEQPPGTLPDYPQGVMLSAEGLKTFIQELADLYIAGGYEASAIGDEIYEVFNNSRTRAGGGGFGTREEIIALLTMELGSEGEAVLEQFADFFMMASNIWQFADYAGTGEYTFQDFVEAQIDSYELGSLTDFPEAFSEFTGIPSPANPIEEGTVPYDPQNPSGQPAQQGEGLPVAPPIPISQIPYIPGADGKLGDWNWLDLWGDTNPLVEDFFDFWVDKFNETPSDGQDMGYAVEDLQHDFFYDDTHGLYAQDWWIDQQQSLLDHMEFFYNYGGEGDIESVLNTTMGGDAWRPWTGIVGIADRPETNAYNSAILEFTEWAREAIREAGGKDALLSGVINDFELAGYAYLIMSNGGATFKLGKDREGFRPDEFKEKAKQLIEKQFLANWTDEDGNFIEKMSGTMSFGVGSIRSLMNDWRALGKRNFQDFSDNELRKWAVDVKSEKLTKEMVDAEITKRAFHRIEWPFTPEEREDYIAKGATLDDVLNGQYLSVKSLWEDASLLPDDPWLLANYSFTDENGNRRFRSSQELMTHARTNMDKFQYSNESKDFHNDFITGAARMFRSGY